MALSYGTELILDLHDCDVDKFNRDSLDGFFEELCFAINMQMCERHFWDDVGVPENEKQISPHTKGTSAIQFILTSNITVHTLDELGKVFINIFSCKDFDPQIARDVCCDWFRGTAVNSRVVIRE